MCRIKKVVVHGSTVAVAVAVAGDDVGGPLPHSALEVATAGSSKTFPSLAMPKLPN